MAKELQLTNLAFIRFQPSQTREQQIGPQVKVDLIKEDLQKHQGLEITILLITLMDTMFCQEQSIMEQVL